MATVRIHEAQVRVTANRLTVKHVRQTVAAIEHGARLRALRGEYTTGALAASIHSRVWTTGWKVQGTVGSNLPYAKFSDGGTNPHIIRPRGAGYPLRFYWRRVGHVVTPWKVNHPGQRGKKWLTEPTRIQTKMRGWRLILHGG